MNTDNTIANEVNEVATTSDLEMEIFRAGDYGAKGRYSEADIQALAEDYRPELLEAPLTFDHAQTGPAYGWVSQLRRSGDRLLAVLRNVPDSVRELVRSGAFKQRSIELMRSFKQTGRPYLRAVTLLGAATPEVKGLSEVLFSADEAEAERIAETDEAVGRTFLSGHTDATIQNSHNTPTWPDKNVQPTPNDSGTDNAVLLRDGKAFACEQLELPLDRVTEQSSESPAQWDGHSCPSQPQLEQNGETSVVTAIECAVTQAADAATLPSSLNSDGAATLQTSVQDAFATLRAEVADLQRQLRTHAADTVFAELRQEGYAIPERHEHALRQFAAALQHDVIHFSETESTPVADWLRQFLRATSPRVPLGAASPAPIDAPGSLPADMQVHFSERTDPASIQLHHRALALMQHEVGLSYAAAVAKASVR